MRTNEGKAPGDRALDSGLPRMKHGHRLGGALALSIGGTWLQPIGPAKIGLRNVRDLRRLFAIHRAGTDE